MSTAIQIREVLTGLKSSYGEAFFQSLTLQLANLIGADFTFIARLDFVKHSSRTIAMVANGEIAENFEYSLEYTPCDNVANDDICIYPEGICSYYPKDQLLIDMGIEGYIGTPLHNSDGEVFGLIVALYNDKIEDVDKVTELFKLFSGRISAEIERSEKEKALKELNNTLELKVEQRTRELSETLEHLQETQHQIIEKEKLASLGRLVAGVAHEINTPLGIAILSHSVLAEKIRKLEQSLTEGSISRSEAKSLLGAINEAEHSIGENLTRAAELVTDFKQIATDHHADDRQNIELCKWLQQVASSVSPMVSKARVSLRLILPSVDCFCETYPSKLAQVITNVVANSLNHAFPPELALSSKAITIELRVDEDAYHLLIEDNGVGMAKDVKQHLTEPFFTTKRTKGGMGLGMSIVNNLVVGPLQGGMTVESLPGKGTCVTIILPKILS